MSEITKITKAMEAITPVVMELSTNKTYSTNNLQELTQILNKLRNYRGTCDTAMSKINERDPVTQEPRYGPIMIQKIQNLDVNLQTVLEITDLLIKENITAIETQEAEERVKKEIMQREIEQQQQLQAQELQKLHQVSSTMEEGEGNDKDNINSIDLAQLNAQAEAIREKKRNQLLMEKIQREMEIHNLFASTDILNSLWSSSVFNRNQIITALTNLRTVSAEQQEQDQFTKISGFVIDVLEKISKRPDDEKLRKIRINHPFIKNLFGRSSFQAICLLLSVGFIARPVLASGDLIPSLESQQQDLTNDHPPLSQEEALKILRDLIANEESSYTLLLEMFEPPVVAGETSRWIRWFDGLTESISVVTEAMISMS